ncbi:ImmA/IrrE family metallo-endopeptidase [Sphingomonas sp. C8-2]|nr:ImmA/IrrE family metallo-endopeptidase [Sphingomonas sp. C8-2]
MNEAIRRARLKGAAAATKVQRFLDVRERIMTTHERVDIFDALAWLDVRVVFKPLDGLLGAYIRGDQPGVMISTKRPLSVQRFTAAHELGHAFMAHEPSLDSPNVLRRAAHSLKAPKIDGFASYLQEIEADEFAGTFLLPMWLISHHANKQGWSRSRLAEEDTIYQLSLRCGSSYQATVWALERNRVISAEQRARLLEIKPKKIKERLGHVAGAAETRYDAWLLGQGDNRADIAVNVGDTITVSLEQQAGAGYLWLSKAPPPASLTELDAVTSLDPDLVGAPSAKRIFYRADAKGVGSLPFEHKRPWEAASQREVVFNFSVMPPEGGLSRANRARMVESRQKINAG